MGAATAGLHSLDAEHFGRSTQNENSKCAGTCRLAGCARDHVPRPLACGRSDRLQVRSFYQHPSNRASRLQMSPGRGTGSRTWWGASPSASNERSVKRGCPAQRDDWPPSVESHKRLDPAAAPKGESAVGSAPVWVRLAPARARRVEAGLLGTPALLARSARACPPCAKTGWARLLQFQQPGSLLFGHDNLVPQLLHKALWQRGARRWRHLRCW